jgi:hypothetical protein
MPITTPPKASTVLSTLAMFDLHGGEPVVRFKRTGLPFAQTPRLTLDEYNPRGTTPLNDATAQMIHALAGAFDEQPDAVHIGLLLDESGSMSGNRSAVVESYNEFVDSLRAEAPAGEGRVLCVVMTDGLENASSEYSSDRLRELIVAKEATGWTFIYLGANHDAWAAAQAMGVANAARWTSSPSGTRSTNRAMAQMGAEYLREASPKARPAVMDHVLKSVAPGGEIPEADAVEAQRAVERAKDALRDDR